MTDGDYKMDASEDTTTETFISPPPAKWKMRLCRHDYGLVFMHAQAPNALHRWMQRVCLGIIWERV